MPFEKLKHMKILLIDDDEFVRDSLTMLFTSKGCCLTAVETAEDGIEALRREDFDVFIADFKLPGIDGLEFLKGIKMSHPRAKRILITAYGSEEMENEAGEDGLDALIEKPITSEAIRSSLSRIFGRTR